MRTRRDADTTRPTLRDVLDKIAAVEGTMDRIELRMGSVAPPREYFADPQRSAMPGVHLGIVEYELSGGTVGDATILRSSFTAQDSHLHGDPFLSVETYHADNNGQILPD